MSTSFLRAAAGVVDITPDKPVPLAGWGTRTGDFTAVADPLEAAVLVVRWGGETVAIASVDSLYVTSTLHERLAAVMVERGIDGSHLLVGATHTHFAPALDATKPGLGRTDPAYVERITGALAELLAEQLDAEAQPAALRYRRGTAAHAVNRRRQGWTVSRHGPKRTLAMLPNFDGQRDDAVHVLSVDDEHGSPIAILWNTACHPVSFPHSAQVSAEFPGVARRRLRARFRRHEVPTLFLQGFAGDLRPRELTRPRGGGLRNQVACWVSRVTNGLVFGRFRAPEWFAWATSLAETVVDLTAEPMEALAPDLAFDRARLPLSEVLDDGGSAATDGLSLQAVRVAPHLVGVGVGAEPVAAYSEVARAAFAPAAVIPIGCVGQVLGYLPSSRTLREGGYEAEGSLSWMGVSGRFRPDVEEATRRAMTGLAEHLRSRAESSVGSG